MKLTNTSKAVRIINVKDGDKVRRATIQPGETVDVTPIETPVFKALKKDGVFMSPSTAEKEAEAKAKAEAEAKK